MAKNVYLELFKPFFQIGAFTFGGGYAMIPLIQRETVQNHGWISDDDILEIIAIAESTPGPISVNSATFVGYRTAGIPGAACATFGLILPSFLIILAIAALFTGYQDNPVVIRIFKGIRPVVVALIAVPMVRMAKKSCGRWWSWLILCAAFGLTVFLKISPIYILLCTIVVSLSVAAWNEKRTKKGGEK